MSGLHFLMKMEKTKKYKPIIELIKPTDEEIKRVVLTRDEVKERLDISFRDQVCYRGAKIIGSAATGHFLRGYRDIDVLLAFEGNLKKDFKEGIMRTRGLDNIIFKDKCEIVMNKANCRFNHFDVSIGAIDSRMPAEQDLASDMYKHPDFVKKRLSPERVDEVYLAKQFLKNVGLYGAKIDGFAVEQMIISFGSFNKLLAHLINGSRVFVDFSGKYQDNGNSFVVTYPFSGLDNLTKRVSGGDLEKLREYAKLVSQDPETFLEDARRIINRDFWNKRLRKYGDFEEFSIPDVYLNHRENRVLRGLLRKTQPVRVLDLGCANGHSTIAVNRPGDSLVWAVDSNSSAVDIARKLLNDKGMHGIEFVVGEMTSLNFDREYFDAVYAKRALSNLSSRREQQKAIKGASDTLKTGGRFYIFDIFEEGYARLNLLRSRFGLKEVPLPFHCLPLTDKFVRNSTRNYFSLIREEDPTSTYYVLSRVLIPSLFGPFGIEPKSKSIKNLVFSLLPSFGNVGVNKLYVFDKK